MGLWGRRTEIQERKNTMNCAAVYPWSLTVLWTHNTNSKCRCVNRVKQAMEKKIQMEWDEFVWPPPNETIIFLYTAEPRAIAIQHAIRLKTISHHSEQHVYVLRSHQRQQPAPPVPATNDRGHVDRPPYSVKLTQLPIRPINQTHTGFRMQTLTHPHTRAFDMGPNPVVCPTYGWRRWLFYAVGVVSVWNASIPNASLM